MYMRNVKMGKEGGKNANGNKCNKEGGEKQ
jgi:hypothetical protein